MSRKDTILVAVIVNTVLLAILFATAIIYDVEVEQDASDFIAPVADAQAPTPTEAPVSLVAVHSGEDEAEHVLKYYVQPSMQPVAVETSSEEVSVPEPVAVQTNAPEEEWVSQETTEPPAQESFVEITVKKGDVLEKLARANGTTVGAIKKANHLSNEKLSIGQVLKVPVKKGKVPSSQRTAKAKQEDKVEANGSEAVYYVIKSGDNPWKIAKQFNTNSEDILKLNQMDEERARNLKAGEKIRVK